MPTYDHQCTSCQGFFEEIYSMKDPIPTKCPICNTEGGVKRLISRPAKGVVELNGHELLAHVKEEAGKAVIEARNNENYRANIIGEDKYHASLLTNSRLNQELNPIKRDIKWGRRVK